MTLYELVTQEITARQAGQLYGLRFSRNGRAFCPWHDDGKHPALGFYDGDRKCHCFVCGNGGNSIGLTAQILGISYHDAAVQLQKDFNLDEPDEYRRKPHTDQKPKRTVYDEKKELDKRWIHLCEVSHEAYDRLKKYTPRSSEQDYDKFTMLLGAKCDADHELDYMWEVTYPEYERT